MHAGNNSDDVRRRGSYPEHMFHDVHPGYRGYTMCMSRAYGWGLASFAVGFSLTYCTQRLLVKYIRTDPKVHILVSSIVACVAAYKVTKDHAKVCQDQWFLMEPK